MPDDVTIVGFDDLSWSAAASVPLTTVSQPREELGRRAVRLLLDEIDRGDAHTHSHELLVPELVVRESSAATEPRPKEAVMTTTWQPELVPDELVALTRALGEPAKDLVILAEGNTSKRLDDGRIVVKASGAYMADPPRAKTSSSPTWSP